MKSFTLLIFMAILALQTLGHESRKPLSEDIFCPSIAVKGKPVVASTREKLVFVGDVSGIDVGAYRWTVAGGRIIRGQGTSTISVRINRSMHVGEGIGVTATLKIKGIDPRGGCLDSASYTTILAPIPNTD